MKKHINMPYSMIHNMRLAISMWQRSIEIINDCKWKRGIKEEREEYKENLKIIKRETKRMLRKYKDDMIEISIKYKKYSWHGENEIEKLIYDLIEISNLTQDRWVTSYLLKVDRYLPYLKISLKICYKETTKN